MSEPKFEGQDPQIPIENVSDGREDVSDVNIRWLEEEQRSPEQIAGMRDDFVKFRDRITSGEVDFGDVSPELKATVLEIAEGAISKLDEAARKAEGSRDKV